MMQSNVSHTRIVQEAREEKILLFWITGLIGFLPKFITSKIWTSMILASILLSKFAKFSHLSCQIFGNFFCQLLACQILNMTNFSSQLISLNVNMQ